MRSSLVYQYSCALCASAEQKSGGIHFKFISHNNPLLWPVSNRTRRRIIVARTTPDLLHHSNRTVLPLHRCFAKQFSEGILAASYLGRGPALLLVWRCGDSTRARSSRTWSSDVLLLGSGGTLVLHSLKLRRRQRWGLILGQNLLTSLQANFSKLDDPLRLDRLSIVNSTDFLLITNINKPNNFIQPILKFGFVYLQEWCSWPAMNDRVSLESILRTWIKLVQFLVANPLLFSWIVEVVTVNYLGRKFTVFFFRLNSIFNIFVYLRMSVWHIETFILGWRSIKERDLEQENCLRIPLIQQYASMPCSATCQCPIVIFEF
jgi:hypothetical protein